MKRTMAVAAFGIGIAVLAAAGASARAETPLPGQVDFGTFSPPGSKGEFVEINVPASLIGLAARFFEKQEPDVAKLLNGLQLVHVSVIGLNDQNRAEFERRAEKVRKELEAKGWERVVKVVKEEQDIGIYLKTQGKETVQGLALVLFAGKEQAVFANIVGDIKPEQLALLGERLHIEPLKNLGQMTNNAEQ
ncbi:MAG: DUF4252 domain-containing protein [Verrucomicrobiota bacterium]|jgi:hypothetical protein